MFYTLHLILGNFGFTPSMRSEVTDCKRLYRFGSARSLRSFSVNILGEWMMTSITLGLIGRKGSSSPDTEDAVVRSFHCKRTRQLLNQVFSQIYWPFLFVPTCSRRRLTTHKLQATLGQSIIQKGSLSCQAILSEFVAIQRSCSTPLHGRQKLQGRVDE